MYSHDMLMVRRLSVSAAGYYRSGPPGQWLGGGAALLGLAGPVGLADLRAVLRGCDPSTGEVLPSVCRPERRAGWDLIYAAPKSVSLLAATAGEPAASLIVDAHRRAVADAVGWLEERVCWARRRGALVATDGVVAARFDHTTSSAEEPHLHTHAVVANLAPAVGAWSAIDGSGLWLQRRGMAAVYDLALRHRLRQAGLCFEWQLTGETALDVAAVPSKAVRAVSSRRAAIDAAAGPDPATPSAKEATRHRLRVQPAAPWWPRLEAAGFSAADAARVVEEAATRAADTRARDGQGAGPSTTGDGRRLTAAAVVHLAERRSTFAVPDALAALAAVQPDGADPRHAQQWAEQLYAASLPAPDGRRTTPYAQALDARLEELIRQGAGRSVTALDPPAREGSAPTVTWVTDRLVGSRDAVVVLGPVGSPAPEPGRSRPPAGRDEAWLAQAAVLEAAGRRWQAAGMEVTVQVDSAAAAARWRALTGLPAVAPGSRPASRPDPAGRSVLIIDRADRATTAELTGWLSTAARTGSTVVLVQGGTLPARRRAISEGLEQVAASRSIAADTAALPPAVDRTVARWAEAGANGRPPLLVGLGPAECLTLNRLAREQLRSAGRLSPDEVAIGTRAYAVGDRVVALRLLHVPAGTRGQVAGVEPRAGRMAVHWGDGTQETIDRRRAARVGHGYATTPRMLRFSAEPVLVLGDPADLGRYRGRAVEPPARTAARPARPLLTPPGPPDLPRIERPAGPRRATPARERGPALGR